MKKVFVVLVTVVIAVCSVFAFTACGGKEKVMIYTSSEDYTMDYMQECLDKAFPDYEIHIEYMSTSNIAARVIEEGASSDCDLIFAEEYGFIEQMAAKNVLADLSELGYDYGVYTDDALATEAKNYLMPAIRTGGGIIVNTRVLNEKGLKKPESYDDLLAPGFAKLVSMPSPKSSGTGYMFYIALVNEWGEQAAIEYFDKLSENVLAFTSSGSGPVNALVNREVAVGFGMLSQAAEKISAGNNELEILFFEEGAPCNLYGNCVVKGKETKKSVRDVLDYLYENFTDMCCARYYPEPVLKGKTYSVEAFPDNIVYSDMSNNTSARKQELLAKWTH